jgi:U4/U6.U5 tri-snRNP-associated protein 2
MEQVYVLPDSYEVNDPSLDDIKYVLSPTFKRDQLRKIDTGLVPSHDLANSAYLPGFLGLNNIKANSYMNVVLQSLLHVPPLRDYFIFSSQPSTENPSPLTSKSELVARFGLLARKLWNPKAFKSQVSPHEFLQEVTSASGRKFRITEGGDPLEFLSWLLNSVHRDLGGTRKERSSVIYSAFQGEMRIEDQAVIIKPDAGNERPKFDIDRGQ